MTTAWNRLLEILGEVDDLQRAAAVMHWDRECYMPRGGAAARTQQTATLARLAHERFTSDEVGELLERAEAEHAGADPDSFEARVLRVTRRRYDKARRTPPQLVAAMSRARGEAYGAWLRARAERRFEPFRPALERLVELQREWCDAQGYEGHPYDALIDGREPGMTTTFLDALFARLKDGQIPLVEAIASSPRAAAEADQADPLAVDVDPQRLWALGDELLKAIGFDFQRGRRDRSVHPFCTMFSPDDVRLTVRPHAQALETIFTVLHEGGHALYNQGIPAAFARTPLCSGASGGVHESQSRMWENLVGRSRPFWSWFGPLVRERFPELGLPGDDELYRLANRVKPDLIRTEADEVTYNLHIILRYELEKAVLTGDLPVAELPGAWAEKLRAYLGVVPRDDLEGVLQDIHWTGGFGGFPSYTLGNVIGVQLWRAAQRDLPDLEARLARGEFGELLAWMRRHVHAHGAGLEPDELVRRATGASIDPGPYLDYLWTKYGELYGVAPARR